VESNVKRADLLIDLGRPAEALEAYLAIAEFVQRGGTPLARQRLKDGIERAQRLVESAELS
jgi:hypothetical protein